MLLLLDIDGVMVRAASWKKVDTLEDGFFEFTPMAVSGLRKIISATGASIVLTSSHKSTYSVHQWKKIFKNRGIEASISKLDDNSDSLSRKDEIIRWFKKHKSSEDFVIIDDDKSLNDLPKDLKARVVLTKPLVGLNEDDALKAIEVLKNPVLA